MWVWLVAASAGAAITEVEIRVEHIDTKPQIVVSVTGDPCPESALGVRLDGKALQPVKTPTTCEVHQKLNKSWWRLSYSGAPPGPGQHVVEIEVGGGDTLRATFTQPQRPTVELPKTITGAPVTVRSADPAQPKLVGQLGMRPTAGCSAVFKAPLRGPGPEYAVTFVPRVCEGRAEVGARLTSELDVACEAVSCEGESVWVWQLGEVAFDLAVESTP